MAKTLTRIWQGHLSFDDAVKSGDGKYITIITSTNREIKPNPIKGTILKVGVINDFCEEYEVVEAQSGANWKDFAELTYEKDHLKVSPKCGYLSMNMPIVIE
jgi:hypothetical protein